MWNVTKTEAIGGSTVSYLRSSAGGGEGAHRVTFPTGAEVTIWPDARTSAQARSRAIRISLERGAGVASLIGALVMLGCSRIEWRKDDGASGDLETDLEMMPAMLAIGHLPNRKRPALYTNSGDLEVLAFFTSDEAADRAKELLV